MKTGRVNRAFTGLAAGAILGAAVTGLSAWASLVGMANVAFSVFEWLVRALPGRLVIFGLETTLRLLEGLGLSIKDTSKTVEEVLAYTGLFVALAVAGLLLFAVTPPGSADRAPRRGATLGVAIGAALFAVVLTQTPVVTANGALLDLFWVVGLFALWGWALGRLYLVVFGPALSLSRAGGHVAGERAELQASRLDRRHFVIRAGGLVATFVVLGAEVAEVLRVRGGPAVPPLTRAPIPFPNEDSRVHPVPGTRPEYTPVADHYRIDIDLSPPDIDPASWRLKIGGMVGDPAELTLEQLKAYPARDQFITLECVSNPIGGPLIGTTLWSGPSFRDVLADRRPLPGARYAHLLSQDGFDEVVDLALVQADPRIVLAHSWNGRPLPREHGFPLRVYVPDLYGMKQPKWIVEIVLVADSTPGYWVERGWDAVARRRTTSVIDVVATADPVRRGGQVFVPVGGIADAGARGISRVEVQVDGGPWQAARLRAPLSGLTWVLWRYEWPWREGTHVFAVRAFDGQGHLQVTDSHGTFPSGATGIDTETATLLPL